MKLRERKKTLLMKKDFDFKNDKFKIKIKRNENRRRIKVNDKHRNKYFEQQYPTNLCLNTSTCTHLISTD